MSENGERPLPALREGRSLRPIAAIHHAFPMLRRGPLNQSFVHLAAFCRLKRRSADLATLTA